MPRASVHMAVGGDFMDHIPDWERLSDALKRIILAGTSKHKAQVNLCRATAERKIKIRYEIGREEVGGVEIPRGHGMSGQVIWNMDIIPRSLTPADFDWQESRPTRSWQVPYNPVFWQLAWIELSSSDVTRVIIGNRNSATDQPIPQPNSSRPARALAEKALLEIFQGKIPDRTEMTDQELCGKVQEWLKNTKHRKVGCDSIWRAAGRRN
jgi:hypothetical protein